MKKLLLVIISLFLLVGCSTKEEDEKIAYLEYKNELEEVEDFTSEVDFNTYFNILREDEETVNYSLIINNPKVNMNNVKALLIHDYSTEDAYPSVGIFDEPAILSASSDDSIILKGVITSNEDLSDVKFKLYLEYSDDDGELNKVYYDVKRG